jgi:hypothetical protein
LALIGGAARCVMRRAYILLDKKSVIYVYNFGEFCATTTTTRFVGSDIEADEVDHLNSRSGSTCILSHDRIVEWPVQFGLRSLKVCCC